MRQNEEEGEYMLLHLVEAFIRSDQVTLTQTFDNVYFDDGVHQYEVIKPLACDCVLRRISEKDICIEGTAQIGVSIPCDRCAIDVQKDVKVTIDRTISLHDSEEFAYVNGAELNVDMFLLMELLMEFPQKVLCSNECKGLCEQCGENLNEQECSCEKGHIDIRMAHLKDLFENKFKEV